ncbi:MAG: M48 family metalloprotease [Planctomycetales bacterium]|nr:M48 family metalloprotease [Planctomycetales bacterium]
MMTYFLLALLLGVSAAMTVATNWLALRPWRRAADAHWTERARLLWPARVASSVATLLAPAIVVLTYVRWPVWGPVSILGGAVAALAGAISGNYPLAKEIYPDLTLGHWTRSMGLAWTYRLVIGGLFGAAAAIMPERAGWMMLAVVAGLLICYVPLLLGGVVPILVRVGALNKPSDCLQRIVAETATRLQISVSATWEFSSVLANACAMPFRGELLFSTRLLEVLNDEEVATVCAHEMGHLSESRRAKFARLVLGLVCVPMVFAVAAYKNWGFPGVLAIGLWILVGLKLMKAMSRRLETRADAIAHDDQSEDGLYARALETIYRVNQVPAVIGKRRDTHPDLYDRMTAAGVTPDYPRPRAVPRVNPIVVAYIAGLAAAILANIIEVNWSR